MATRKKKADKPLLWNPNKITPLITSTGIAIGSSYVPPIRTDLSPEELWIQNLLLPQGVASISLYNLPDRVMFYSGIAMLVAVAYLVLRH